MRSVRGALPEAAIAARSAAVAERVLGLPDWQRARSIASYWPISGKNEVDLRALDAEARRQGKLVFYPFMDPIDGGFRTGFRGVKEASQLSERGRRFHEPPPEAPEAARGEIDLVLVPALAASATAHRLGWGAGFYDVTLPDVRPPAVAVVVVFDFQLLPELPTEAHDLAADFVVTDQRVLAPG